MEMRSFIPEQMELPRLHQLMLSTVAPRPIALASTIDENGTPNLSPFSFYNVFGINPTTLIFSPSRRVRDNTTKHTLENLKQVPQVVINVVTYSMVQQINLASTEYEKGVNEFIKSGLTPLPSSKVRPFRVAESPVHFECTVRQIIETSQKPGAGNLVICEIVAVHVDETVLDANGRIITPALDLVGRMGGDYYVRASGQALFEVEKPLERKGIGVDALPEHVRSSTVLTGNDLGRLGNLESLPSSQEIEKIRSLPEVKSLFADDSDTQGRLTGIHELARSWMAANRVKDALCLLCLP